jgi:hypothetical protein
MELAWGLTLCLLLLKLALTNASEAINTTLTGNDSGLNAYSKENSPLERRQCKWDATAQDFVCDEWLPTLDEMVARMHDTNDQGRATPETHAFFYSNLISPTTKPEDFQDELYEMWYFIEQWIANHKDLNIVDNYYGASAPGHFALNVNWAARQKKYIFDNKALLNAKYTEAGQPVSELRAEFLFDACYSQALAYACQVSDQYYTGILVAWLTIL